MDATLLGDTRLACTAPAYRAASTAALEVTVDGYTFTMDAVTYSFYHTVVIHSLVPSGGPARGGTLVLVSGSGLAAGSDHRCKFGRRIVRAEVADGGGLVCTSPEQ